MQAAVVAIEYYLPARTVSAADLALEFPEWQVDKIAASTGVDVCHIAEPDECSSDLAVAAAQKLFESGVCRPADIDYLLLCTQSPDYFLPTTACLVQDRLGISRESGALDFNLGSSGYVYGLGLAQGLIASGQARNLLFITVDTYSKFIHPRDKSVRTIIGDAATATLVTGVPSAEPFLGPFVYGTDGRGAPNLIVPAGGLRKPRTPETAISVKDESGNERSANNLFMNGAEIFTFTISVVPPLIDALLAKASKTLDDVDLFVFHQANRYMLDYLRKRTKIPIDKFQVTIRDCGNTVSSTIPIALKHAALEGKLHEGSLIMLVGFGVGYSWGATLLRWGGIRVA